jgi:NAD(P)-dependent dehydrogenase (short-subunit alcohol dehydrogenase family)
MKTTAAEVMAGLNLGDKTAIVTGGYSGIGIETTRALEQAGADVFVPARRPDHAQRALADAGLKARVAAMDLADLVSVRKFASEFCEERDALHLLINNAGIMACPETRIGPNWEAQFATNHIGHFVLADALISPLKNAGGARVVSLSSVGHKRSPIDFDDIHFEQKPYEKWAAYGQAKTANALFALELNRRFSTDGIKAFSVHPGGIMTPLQRHLETEEMVALGWLDEKGELSEQAKAMFKTPEQGCATTLWCATSEKLNDKGGEYCEDCDIAVLMNEDTPRYFGVAPWATDDEAAARLWDVTEEMARGS